MSLDAEVTKGFLVSLQLLCFEWRFKRKKLLKELDTYIKQEIRKGVYKNITSFQNVVQTVNKVSDVLRS